ncbi:MAG: hypothetical protein RIC95_07665 [Vicingaceae bacterium]
MKTFKNILLCTLILSVLLPACKKDDPISGGSGGSNPPNVGNTNNCLLKKEIYYLESDTVNKSTTVYHYNHFNKPIKKLHFSGGYAYDSTLFEYDSEQKLKFVFEFSTFTNSLDTIKTYEYDNQDRLIKMFQYTYDTLNAILNFSYNGNSELPSTYFADFKHSPSEKHQLSWLNGNLVQSQIIEVGGSPTNPRPTYTFAYDQKDNPYKGLYSYDLLFWEMFSSNNVKSISIQDRNNSLTQTYDLTYNNDVLVKRRSQLQGQSAEITELEYSCN